MKNAGDGTNYEARKVIWEDDLVIRGAGREVRRAAALRMPDPGDRLTKAKE
jgi:hypothetical protein